MKYYLFALSSLLFFSCDQKPDIIIHPVKELFPVEAEIDHKIELEGTDFGVIKSVLNPYETEVYSNINADSELSEEYFYFNRPPKKIDVDPDQNIYMVQQHVNRVNVYNKNGSFLYSIGREGRGPGEFLQINTFDFSEDYNRLYILDALKVEIFIKKDEIFEQFKTIPLYLQDVSDFCTLNDKLYVSGSRIDNSELETLAELDSQSERIERVSELNLSKPIHRIDAESGDYEFDFGFLYESPGNIGPISALLTETMLTCNKQTNTVIGVLSYYPFIFGYNEAGNRIWTSEISDFKSVETIEEQTAERGPVLTRFSNTDIFNRYLPLKTTDSKYSILQTVYSYPQNKTNAKSEMPNPRVRTILIDSETGELTLKKYHSFIGVQNNGLMITVDIDSVSHIASFSIFEY